MPHTYIVAKTKASEIETGLPTRRVITTGRSSLSTTTSTIMASGGPISASASGVSWDAPHTTRAPPSQAHTCHVRANTLGRHRDGRSAFWVTEPPVSGSSTPLMRFNARARDPLPRLYGRSSDCEGVKRRASAANRASPRVGVLPDRARWWNGWWLAGRPRARPPPATEGGTSAERESRAPTSPLRPSCAASSAPSDQDNADDHQATGGHPEGHRQDSVGSPPSRHTPHAGSARLRRAPRREITCQRVSLSMGFARRRCYITCHMRRTSMHGGAVARHGDNPKSAAWPGANRRMTDTHTGGLVGQRPPGPRLWAFRRLRRSRVASGPSASFGPGSAP